MVTIFLPPILPRAYLQSLKVASRQEKPRKRPREPPTAAMMSP